LSDVEFRLVWRREGGDKKGDWKKKGHGAG